MNESVAVENVKASNFSKFGDYLHALLQHERVEWDATINIQTTKVG